MVIEFTNDPLATPEMMVKSLRDNVQLAFNELSDSSDSLYKDLLKALGVQTKELRNDFSSAAERIDEEARTLTDAVEGALGRLSAVEDALGTLQDQYTALEARVRALEGA